MTEVSWMHQALRRVALMGDLEPDEAAIEQVNSRKQLLARLEEMVVWLMDKDMEKLLWILYRVDVSEQRIKEALAAALPEDSPRLIAEMLLEREEQKEQFRKQYSRPADNESDPDLLL